MLTQIAATVLYAVIAASVLFQVVTAARTAGRCRAKRPTTPLLPVRRRKQREYRLALRAAKASVFAKS